MCVHAWEVMCGVVIQLYEAKLPQETASTCMNIHIEL